MYYILPPSLNKRGYTVAVFGCISAFNVSNSNSQRKSLSSSIRVADLGLDQCLIISLRIAKRQICAQTVTHGPLLPLLPTPADVIPNIHSKGLIEIGLSVTVRIYVATSFHTICIFKHCHKQCARVSLNSLHLGHCEDCADCASSICTLK